MAAEVPGQPVQPTGPADAPASALIDPRRAAVAQIEKWFVQQGVPHFVDGPVVSPRVPAALQPAVFLVVLVREGLLLVLWTVRRVAAEIREVGHLAARALPLLALFGMVIFFSGDFWHIAAALNSGRLWVASGFFVALTLVFLVARIPEELRGLPATATAERIRASCAHTPLAAELLADPAELATDPRLGLAQRRNMAAYLLLCQAIQVSLLSWLVFFFYVVFGAITIRPEVLKGWFGTVPADTSVLGMAVPGVSPQLVHVAVMLAGLSALYFAITALTDKSYRREFFDRTLGELERAIAVRCGYLSLKNRQR
jgi:hypothetical protein